MAAVVAATALAPVAESSEPLKPEGIIAKLTAESPVSAEDGWVIWSVQQGVVWKLRASHDDQITTLPVPARSEPFDAAVGSDIQGRAVVTFSRCAEAPGMAAAGDTRGEGGLLVEPSSGKGCRVRVFNLITDRESSVPIPHPAGSSDTTPVMSRGVVAFSRLEPRVHGLVSQVMLWTPAQPRQLQSLRHGTVPSHCPTLEADCRTAYGWGEVQSLAFDSKIVAFVWQKDATWRKGGAGSEFRIDNVATRRGHIASAASIAGPSQRAGAHASDVCFGPNPVEFEWPGTVSVVGSDAYFSRLEAGYCFTRFAAHLIRAGAGPIEEASVDSSVVTWAVDGATSQRVALVAERPREPQTAQDGLQNCSMIEPCTLERIAQPTFSPR